MELNSVVQFRGTIYENGYGQLARKVMRDKSLPKMSKLIYAYMCSFGGMSNGDSLERFAFPSVALQCDELGMSEDTYYKWRKYLITAGYLTIESKKENGKFARNFYYINAVPVPPENTENEPNPKKSGMEKPHPKNSGTKNSGGENSGTNINSSSINNFNNDDDEYNKPRARSDEFKILYKPLAPELLEFGFPKNVVNSIVDKFALFGVSPSLITEKTLKKSLSNFYKGYNSSPDGIGNVPMYFLRCFESALTEFNFTEKMAAPAPRDFDPDRAAMYYNWLEE